MHLGQIRFSIGSESGSPPLKLPWQQRLSIQDNSSCKMVLVLRPRKIKSSFQVSLPEKSRIGRYFFSI